MYIHRISALAFAVLALLLFVSGCSRNEQQEIITTVSEETFITTSEAVSEFLPLISESLSPESSESSTEKETVSTTAAPETENPPETEVQHVESDAWKLILVNATHPIPENYPISLKQLRNNQQVDERIYPELQQMFDDARKLGIYPLINESYRTSQRQQEIMDKYIASFESQGFSHSNAVEKAHSIVALPGTSEHELGLALDIIDEYNADSTKLWQWLRENCWKYGFILRYPADKVEITGIDYEPWHFRYVGVPTAEEIMKDGLCLEEYLELTGNH